MHKKIYFGTLFISYLSLIVLFFYDWTVALLVAGMLFNQDYVLWSLFHKSYMSKIKNDEV